MALRKALKLVDRLNKQVSDIDANIMVSQILDDLDTSGWQITRSLCASSTLWRLVKKKAA